MTKYNSAAFIAKKHLGFAPTLSASTLYKVVTFTLALLLVACAAGGGGGGGSTAGGNQVSAFSHNSYAFAADLADSDVLDATPQVVGRVLINNNRIRSLVAQRSGITDPQLISALSANNGYSISLSIDATGNPDVATFFKISQDGIITVSNPFTSAGFTFGDVRGYLTGNRINVKLTITVASPSTAAANAIIVETVQVRVLDSASRIDLADTTKPSLLLYNRNNVASPAGSRITPATTETINLNGTLAGDRIAAGTTLGTNGEFSFSGLLPAATFTAGATPPAGGAIASPGNVFATADIHTATNITNILNVDVEVSLNSDGSSLATGEISFPAGTALSIVNGNLTTDGSFLNQVAQLVANEPGTLALLNSTTNTFNLNVTSWNIAYDFTRTFTTPAFTTPVPGSVNFAVSGDLDENTNALEDAISFGKPNDSTASISNLVSAFGITRNPARITGTASQATLFYALRSTNNANACGNGDIYLDNNDLTVKAGAFFNHENVAEYDCRLAVSTDGENYRPLVFVLNAGASVNVTGNELDYGITPSIALVSESTGVDSPCSASNPCYYADLNISINDVNEAPVVSLAGAATAFAGSAEGVGPIAAYKGFGSTSYGDSLATAPAAANSVLINVADPDDAQTGTDADNIQLTVSPAHGTAAFNVTQQANSATYQLVVNTTALDYEAFAPAELTADGNATYKITITATDNKAATLTTSATFDFEVTDVKFTPVFVNPTDISDARLPTTAFFKEDNILNGTAGSPLYLLSDILAFNRHRIGSVAAVDPESGSSSGLIYRFIPSPAPTAPTPIHRNLAVAPNTDALGSRLIVAGVGLTDGLTGSVILQASPVADFSNLNAISSTTSIDLSVNNTAYIDAIAAGATADFIIPPANSTLANLTFNRGLPLVVITPERAAQATATAINFNVLDPVTGVSVSEFSNLTSPLLPVPLTMPTSADVPRFGIVPSGFLGAIPSAVAADIAALGLGLGNGLGIFSINSSSGQLSINPRTALSFPSILTVPIYVTPATNTEFNPLRVDITLVTIIVTDVNTAPVATDSSGVVLNTTNKLQATVAEDAPAGTAVASFTITDDRDNAAALTLSGLDASIGSDTLADLFKVDLQDAAGEIAVSISVAREGGIDYETYATYRGELENIILSIADTGRYTKTTPNGLPLPLSVPIPGTSATTTLVLNITLTNVREAPQLTLSKNALEVLESADIGTILSTDANIPIAIDTASNVNAIAVNLNNTSELESLVDVTYTVSPARAAAIFEASPSAVPLSANGGSQGIILSVINSTLLENFGDGREHPISITVTFPATDDAPALSSSIVKNIMLVDDPANSEFLTSALPTTLTINEQDVARSADNSFTLDGFRININDLAKDADELVPVGDKRRVVTPTLILESVALANNATGGLSPNLDKTNVIELVETNGVLTLVVQDPDFIESSLFGNIAVNLQGGTTADATQVISRSVVIAVTQATDKSITYANAANTPVAATPPVYALSYTQTAYVEAVTNFTGIDATTITTIDANTDFTFGGAAISGVTGNYINITDATAVYPALALVGLTSGNFIARDHDALGTFNSLNNNAGVLGGTNITINVNSDTDLSDGLDILSTDAAGNLVDASAEFNAYFNLAVNNTAGETGQRNILITQKLFTQVENATRKYNALDTIQLYAGQDNNDGEVHTLNYFIRARAATDGTSNASNYALAQFSVAVSAAGLNDRAEIMRVALVPNTETNFNNAEGVFTGGTLTIAENAITTNSLDSYDLLIEFSNADAIVEGTVREAASMIAVEIAEGAVTGATALDNAASDGQLISLRASGTGDALTAGAVDLSGATSGSFTTTGVYTVAYDFALAQNLAGSARIVVTVEEFESTPSGAITLGEHQIPLTIVVAPSNAAPVATLSTTLGTTSPRDITAAFTEDEATLPLSGNVPVATTVVVADDDGAIDRTATVAFTGVTNPAGQTDDNPREKAVFSFVDANTVSYNEHSWGVDQFNFDVTYSEPRGFAAVPITYTLPASQDITVTATPDPTVLTTHTFTGFRGAEFLGATVARAITRTATATFTDPDLAYDDDIAAVLGAVTISTSAGELVFSPSTYTLTQGAADDQATLTGVSYSLSLTGAAAVAKDTTEYPIVFNFVEGTDLSGADAVTITFAPQAANPTIVAGDTAFLTGLTGTATVAEGAALNALVGTLTIADADLTKGSPGTFTYTIPTNPRTLVKWETTAPITDTAPSGQRANRLVLAKALDDADVGVHTITWTMVDNLADGAGTLTGTLTLTVTRVDDPAVATPGADIVSFKTPTSLALNRNSNAGATKTFPITLKFNDPDFLEDPVATLESVTYGQVAFSFTYPTIVSGGPQVCRITPTGGSLLAGADSQAPAGESITRTGNLARAADTAITFANIQAASTNCRNIPVGSTLTSVQLSGVTVKTDSSPSIGATTFPAFSTTPPAYVIQGYRQVTHTVAAPALSVPPGASETLTVTITDGDPDDGVAHNPTNSNVVRTSPGSVWAPITVSAASECSSRIAVAPAPAGGYVYTAGSNAAESTVAIIVAGIPGASGSCVLTIRSEGEDGDSIFTTSTVTVQPAPSLSTPPAFTPSSITDANSFDYASDTVALNAQVRSTDSGDTSPISITVIPNDFCSIPSAQQNPTAAAGVGLTDYPITATVTPLKPGTCTVTVTATEDGAPQSRPASITFPELAPNFTATSLTSVARSDISSSILTGGKTFASPNRDRANNGAFAMTLAATNRDLGDDAARSDQARFEITSGASGLCTAGLSSLAEDYSSTATIGGTATTTLTITPTSTTTGGICQAITITATEGDFGEAGATSNGVITIPQGTFVFDSVSTVHAPTVVNAFTDYTTAITYTATATSNDGSIDDSTIVPQSNTETVCRVVTPVDTASASGSTISSTITITPVTPGLCSIAVVVFEDGVIAPARTFTFTLPEVAPTFTVSRATSGNVDSDASETLTLTATKNDSSNNNVLFRIVSSVGGCTVSGLSSSHISYSGGGFNNLGGTATQTVTVTKNDPSELGTCAIEFSATEGSDANGVSDSVTVSFALPVRAPIVSIGTGETNPKSLAASASGISIFVAVQAAKQDPSDSKVTFTANAGSSSNCAINVFDPSAQDYSSNTSNGIATSQIRVAYTGVVGQGTTCTVNVTATEDDAFGGLDSPIVVNFTPVNQDPLIAVNTLTSGEFFPDNIAAVKVGVTATKQDSVAGATLASSFTVSNSNCVVTRLDADVAYLRDAYGVISDETTYSVRLNSSAATSATASDRLCAITFTVTETDGGTGRSATDSVNIQFQQELAPTATARVFPTGSKTIRVTAIKQDNSVTSILGFPQTSTTTSAGCVATTVTPSIIYSSTNTGSSVFADYLVTGNPTLDCGDFTFNGITEGSATLASTTLADSGIVILAAESAPTIALNAGGTVRNPAVGATTGIIAITITRNSSEIAGNEDTLNIVHSATSSVSGVSDNTCTTSVDNSSPNYSSGIANAVVTVRNSHPTTMANTCVVTITVLEDGVPASNALAAAERTVTFQIVPVQVSLNLEVTPAAATSTGVPANQSVAVTAIATKEDASSNNRVNFIHSVQGSNCVVVPSAQVLTNDFSGGIGTDVSSPTAYNVTLTSAGYAVGGTCRLNVNADVDGNGGLAATVEFVDVVFTALPQQSPTITITSSVNGMNGVTYPDDPAVTYTMTITSQDRLSGSTLMSATISRTSGDCSVTRVEDAVYDSNFTGTEIVSVKHDGNNPANPQACIVAFNALEDGKSAVEETRMLTFTPEAAPTFTTSVTGYPTSAVGATTTFDVVAMKNDSGANLSIDFPSPVSAGACSAAIRGPSSKSFSSSLSSASVTAIYDVTATSAGACGTFSISGIKAGSVTAATATVSGITFVPPRDDDGDGVDDSIDNCLAVPNPDQSDLNNDGEGDVCDEDIDGDSASNADDVDDDGDGLIEIYNATQLEMLRNNLAGTGLDADNSDGNFYAGGDNTGCGGGSYANGADITTCNGYELSTNISLASYSDWNEIGSTGMSFSAIFDGNGNFINSMTIYRQYGDNEVGLFGMIRDATIRNVHLTGVNINANDEDAAYRVGALVGNALGTSMILDSSAAGSSIRANGDIGGLVGKGEGVRIIRSHAIFNNIFGSDGPGGGPSRVGGLLGDGRGAFISSSSATITKVLARSYVGGLVGDAMNSRIRSSVAIVNEVDSGVGSGNVVISHFGGLVANGVGADIRGSMAIVNLVRGGQNTGGLIGAGTGAKVISSAAIVHTVDGVLINQVDGGLIGSGTGAAVNNSYSAGITITASGTRGGLIGTTNEMTMISNSYWDSTTLTPSDTRSLDASIAGAGSSVLKSTNTFDDVFAKWGNDYVNRVSGELETLTSFPDTTPGSGTHTQAWNLNALTPFVNHYPLLNVLPITPAEQNTAINKVLIDESPVPAR